MAGVVHCKEVGPGRDANEEMTSRKRYTRVFQLLTDDPKVGAKTVRDFGGLPSLGAQWEQLDQNGVVVDNDADAVLVQKRVSQSDDGNFQNWFVSCEYAGINDPTREPPRVQTGGIPYQEVTQQDLSAPPKQYKNSAGDPFLNGFVRDRNRRTFTIERNVLVWDPSVEGDYIDTLNQGVYLAGRYPPGYAARLAKIKELSSEVVWWENYPVNLNIHYYRVRAVIEIDRRGWDEVPLDQGYRQLIGGKPVRVPDVGGAHSGPILLDGAGGPLGALADPVYLDGLAGRPGPFIKYLNKDWTPISDVIEF